MVKNKKYKKSLGIYFSRFYFSIKDLEKTITTCQKSNHIQQVAYSTYHKALTQICFTCEGIRSSIKEKDLDAKRSKNE